MSKAVCANCGHQIDGAARVCPFCGADPASGERVDTRSLLDEVFHPRDVPAGERVLDFARQRQGVIIAVSALVIFLLLGALQQWASMRNRTAVTDAPPVALTEITDVNNQGDESRPIPLPDLPIQIDGRPQAMRTLIVEPGAVPPPEVLAAQRAAAQQQQPAESGAKPRLPPATPGRH